MKESTPSTSGVKERLIHVLLVDEGTSSRATNFLEANNCVVRGATSAREALEAIDELPPDVLVADLLLGDALVARVLADKLQRDEGTRHVARIAICSSTERRPENVVGFDAYLARPVDLLALLDLVRELTYAGRALRRELEMPTRSSRRSPV